MTRPCMLAGVFAVLLVGGFSRIASAQEAPVVGSMAVTASPPVPAGLKVTCLTAPSTLTLSSICPVLLRNGYVYWGYSYIDNRVGMAIIAFDQNGHIVKRWDKNGARYLWQITVNQTARNVAFSGQSSQAITMSWDELYVPPPAQGSWVLGKVVNNTDKHVMFSFHVDNFGSADAAALKHMTMAGILINDYGILSIDPRGNTSGCTDPLWRAEITFGDHKWNFVYNTGTTLDITISPDRQFSFVPGRGGQVVPSDQAVKCVKK